MKRFILSPFSLLGLALLLFLAGLQFSPNFRQTIGNLFWDSFLLKFYEFCQLYRIWPLFIAGLFGLASLYLITRSGWWRLSLNMLTLALATFGLRRRGFVKFYQHLHSFNGGLKRILLKFCPPPLQTTYYRQIKSDVKRGYNPPNLRYLLLNRSQLDQELAKCKSLIFQRRLIERNLTNLLPTKVNFSFTAPSEDYIAIVARINEYRQRWQIHFQSNLAYQFQENQPLLALILLDLILLGYISHALPPVGFTALDREAVELEKLCNDLAATLRQNAALYAERVKSKPSLSTVLNTLLDFDDTSDMVLKVLNICQAFHLNYLKLNRYVDKEELDKEEAALAYLVVTFGLERLVTYGYYQEALELDKITTPSFDFHLVAQDRRLDKEDKSP